MPKGGRKFRGNWRRRFQKRAVVHLGELACPGPLIGTTIGDSDNPQEKNEAPDFQEPSLHGVLSVPGAITVAISSRNPFGERIFEVM